MAAGSPPDGMKPAAAPPDREPRPPVVSGWWRATLPLLLGVGLTLVARADPELVEARSARGLYPALGAAIARLGQAWERVVPPGGLDAGRPTLAEATLGLGALVLCWRGWRALRGGLRPALRFALGAAGWLYLAFMLLWGLNHAREPLAASLQLRTAPVAPEELAALAAELGEALAEELAALDGNLDSRDFSRLAADAWASRLAEEPELGWCATPLVRAPLASRALTASGISGIFGPHTQECHVAAGLPAVERGFVACHEIAHAQGWAREDEANFLAWRVASRARSPALRISGLALALVHVHGALGRADPALQRARALELGPAVVALLEERASFWRGVRMEAAERVATAVNDAYLRSQGQEGVASYGRMVDLLVAERRAR
ncbi:MAG: DUF3810 family protein [Planctomycetota bacterium]|nr:DUF3810 family protein [Planctomycetota bacterium]